MLQYLARRWAFRISVILVAALAAWAKANHLISF